MTDYRIYRRRSSAGFDGATPEAASYAGERFLFTTSTTDVVGLFGAAALGRQEVASRVSVSADAVHLIDDAPAEPRRSRSTDGGRGP